MVMYEENNRMNEKYPRRCLALYSGGLDSILAIRIMEDQGVDVIPLYFCSPFFGFDALRDPETFVETHRRMYGLNIRVVDYTDDIIGILKDPRHGFGRNLNPCIDCRIGMLRRARSLLGSMQASFVITGEIVGQRPMSQQKHVMHIIEKESGLEDILLRPLCARNLPETLPERQGIVHRAGLWNLSGRGRKVQIERALAHGITAERIPTPGGGCLLTEAQIAHRVEKSYRRCSPELPLKADLMLDIMGRRFSLDDSTVLMVARNDAENQVISTFCHPGNVFMKIDEVPGPLCILRGNISEENLTAAAGICLRYGKAKGESGRRAMYGMDVMNLDKVINAPVFSEEYCRTMQD